MPSQNHFDCFDYNACDGECAESNEMLDRSRQHIKLAGYGQMQKLDIRCLVPGTKTGGAVSIFEEVVQPGIGPPRHTHREQTEVFHVLSGSVVFEIDGEHTEVSAGGAAVVPAGAVHAFKNIGREAATIHFEMIPAGESEEAFKRLVNEEIADPESFFDRYGMDLVGPPLES